MENIIRKQKALLNFIEEEEDSAIPFDSKQIGIKSRIVNTRDLEKNNPIDFIYGLREKKFKPNLLNKLLLSFATIGLCFVFYTVLTKAPFPNKDFEHFIFIILLCLLGLFIIATFVQIVHPKYNRVIVVAKEGLTVNSSTYTWEEIQDTYIIKRPKSKGYLIFLLILFKSGAYEKVSFTHYMGFNHTDIKLAGYIKHFKRK